MRFKGIVGLLSAFVLLGVVLPLYASSTEGQGDVSLPGEVRGPESRGYAEHDIICINGEDDFTPENGVTGGSGTNEDPYIIEGYSIDGSPIVPNGYGGYIELQFNYCIYIGNTTAHFVIRNCYLEGARWPYEPVDFGGGVTLYNVTAGVVENITAYDNKYGVYMRECSNVTVRNITATENLGGVALLEGCSYNTVTDVVAEDNNYGFQLSGQRTHRNFFSNSTARDSSGSGLVIASAHHNLIENIVVIGNGFYGVDLFGSYNILRNVRATENHIYGIYIKGEMNELFSVNASGNVAKGIVFNRARGNSVEGAEVHRNTKHGIEIKDSQRNWIRDAAVSGNNMTGIYLTNSPYNNLTHILLLNNRHYGIGLTESSDHNRIYRVRAIGNLGSILISSSKYNTITHCTFEGSREYGVDAQGGMMCEGNIIHHNNFVNNNNGSVQAYDKGTRNRWNDTSGEGNYWSDYTIRYPNATNDGHVWDTPYDLEGEAGARDHFPLVEMIGEVGEDVYPPVADAGENVTIIVGESVTLNASGSYDPDPEGEIVNYTWTFQYEGDEVILYGKLVVFSFESEGEYEIILNVTDLSGKSGEDTITILVVSQLFNISIGPLHYDDGTPASGIAVTFVGPGISGETTTNSSGHFWMEGGPPGTYEVTLSVDGNAYNFTVVVHNDGSVDYQIPVIPKSATPPPPEGYITISFGPVKDSDGNPLPGVTVIIEFGGEETHFITGPEGMVEIILPSTAKGDEIRVTLRKEGYEDLTFTMGVDSEGNITGSIPNMERSVAGERGEERGLTEHVLWILIVMGLIIVLGAGAYFLKARGKGRGIEE
ncbi:MAG: hypothetical protein DRN28_05885 [Thermoplasmata archaeon]|nr:MAG: hypothetical protein DRN28_05885 [Thermoplasmata archaeon]